MRLLKSDSKHFNPIQVFVSTTGTSRYRKPYVGMWSLFEEHYNDGIKVDRKASVFVGDAAGRPARGARFEFFVQ